MNENKYDYKLSEDGNIKDSDEEENEDHNNGDLNERESQSKEN